MVSFILTSYIFVGILCMSKYCNGHEDESFFQSFLGVNLSSFGLGAT